MPTATFKLQRKQSSSCVPVQVESSTVKSPSPPANAHKHSQDSLPGQTCLPERRSEATLLAPMSECPCRLRSSLVLPQDSHSMSMLATHCFPSAQTRCNSPWCPIRTPLTSRQQLLQLLCQMAARQKQPAKAGGLLWSH